MKYVNFNKVVVRNFLSVGETPVQVDFNKGLNIITGNNKDKVDLPFPLFPIIATFCLSFISKLILFKIYFPLDEYLKKTFLN